MNHIPETGCFLVGISFVRRPVGEQGAIPAGRLTKLFARK
jgi:hypothetical protein